MLPYSSAGAYGGSPYGRRKGFFGSQNVLAFVLAVVALLALGFSGFTHFRASSATSQIAALKRELESARSELRSMKNQYSSRNAELEQLQLSHGHTQRRLTELQSQLQRKEAELVGKEQTLQQHIKEKGVVDQHRSGREAELTKMVEDLRQELLRSDGVIDALDAKVAAMEGTHASREKDWHILANKWIKYEQDLHEQYKKCTEEVSKLRNLTMALNDTAPLPEAEPQLRAETDFAQIKTEIPAHKPHHFEPLPSPAAQTPPVDLPLPEAKIRESIVQMTGGQVGLEPGQQMPDSPAKAPEPSHIHHQDMYHHDFHHEDDVGHHYDHYHGHYDHYDPMDEWWLHDAHGDWNADDQAHGHGHGGGDDVHNHHDQNQHHNYHDQHHQHNYHEQHHQQHDPHKQDTGYNHLHDHEQHRRLNQEMHGGGWGAGDAHHQQPSPMQGMDPHGQNAHAQHAPSPHWQEDQYHHHHQHQQQQYQQQQQQQHYQDHHQQQQQQYGDAYHHQHPRGDLAYKMGW